MVAAGSRSLLQSGEIPLLRGHGLFPRTAGFCGATVHQASAPCCSRLGRRQDLGRPCHANQCAWDAHVRHRRSQHPHHPGVAGRPFLEAALDLCHRIFTEFHYDQEATTVATSVAEVLKSQRGVCQDFAHFTIGCLRSLGLAARYVSGYLTSGELAGSQASHAWVSVFSPGLGWLDLDPTNDRMVNGSYITLAWGRDYTDVAPVNGVALGGGRQAINVSVTVAPAGG